MKSLATLVLSTLLLFACSDSKNTANTEKTAEHEHVYRCPMHPEVTGKEGDTCPKCGMKLEHSDEAPAGEAAYFMQFTTAPSAIEPNKEVKLSLTPKKQGSENEQVALETEHEKKIHLILVSDDLSWFDHIHPEYSADGSYQVTAKFPAAGTYKAFADYKPSGGNHVVDKQEIQVAGTAPAAKTYAGEKLTGSSANYSFELKPTGGKLLTGALMHISGIIKKDGREIDANTLDNYLGAKAHFVMISLNEKEYLHVHPSVDKGQFDLHTNFEKPGIYRAWVQFNADGKIHTIDFTINVSEGTKGDIEKANQAHTDHHSK
jgi:hypothetical protein